MKKTFLALFLILAAKLVNAQSSNDVDRVLKLPDSLTYEKEIRVYEFPALTGYRSIFRMYFGTDMYWHAELYEYNSQRSEDRKDKFEKKELKFKSDGEFIWLKILTTDIQDLADWKSIQYKLKSKGEITYEKGKYDLVEPRMRIMEGVSVLVKIRNDKESNNIAYGNPRTYFGYYPNVDELVSFVILLDLINSEFNTKY